MILHTTMGDLDTLVQRSAGKLVAIMLLLVLLLLPSMLLPPLLIGAIENFFAVRLVFLLGRAPFLLGVLVSSFLPSFFLLGLLP